MTKNIIWLKDKINKQINICLQFKSDYAFGIVDGLKGALFLIEQLDDVDNDVKIRKRMDTMQHQIDVLQKEVLDLNVLISIERGGLNEIKQEAKE